MQIDLEQYVDNVYRFALSLTNDQHVAEDLTQDCFLRAVAKTHQLQKQTAVKAWLFQILVNAWKDSHKKKQIEMSDVEPNELAGSTALPEFESIFDEENNSIMTMMQTLPPQQQTVLFLSAVEQLTNREISSLLNITVNSVKANLSIARKTMRKKLAAEMTRQAKN